MTCFETLRHKITQKRPTELVSEYLKAMLMQNQLCYKQLSILFCVACMLH